MLAPYQYAITGMPLLRALPLLALMRLACSILYDTDQTEGRDPLCVAARLGSPGCAGDDGATPPCALGGAMAGTQGTGRRTIQPLGAAVLQVPRIVITKRSPLTGSQGTVPVSSGLVPSMRASAARQEGLSSKTIPCMPIAWAAATFAGISSMKTHVGASSPSMARTA